MNLSTACIEWSGSRNSRGYGTLTHKGRTHLAHRVEWSNLNGEIPAGTCVLHRCDNPPCINLDHLYLGTKKDNAKDRSDRRRYRDDRGEKHPRAKLKESQVIEIRKGLLAGETGRCFARKFGVSDQLIHEIKIRRAWRHI